VDLAIMSSSFLTCVLFLATRAYSGVSILASLTSAAGAILEADDETVKTSKLRVLMRKSSHKNGETIDMTAHTDDKTATHAERYRTHCEPDQQSDVNWDKYTRFHKACRQDKECLNRAWVWRSVDHDAHGGLGDNIKGLTFMMYAAMRAERPFFVQWQRKGHDMLQFFEPNAIDVSLPGEFELSPCKYTSFNTRYNLSEAQDLFSSSLRCHIWSTNWNPAIMLHGDYRRQWLPWLPHTDKFYAIGCAWGYLFKRAQFTSEYASQYPSLRGSFSAVHIRSTDATFIPASSSRDPYLRVTDTDTNKMTEQALACAKRRNVSNILFLSPDEGQKSHASELSKTMGLKVSMSKDKARHLGDEDRLPMSAEEIKVDILSDFVAIQQADILIVGSHVSGFSANAASIALLPKDSFLQANSCSPFDYYPDLQFVNLLELGA
jgi:hypothetical protein